jgi:hypothetical protein
MAVLKAHSFGSMNYGSITTSCEKNLNFLCQFMINSLSLKISIQYFTQFGHMAELSECELVLVLQKHLKTLFRLRVGEFLQNKFAFT